MRTIFRQIVAILLCGSLAFLPIAGDARQAQVSSAQAAQQASLRDYLQKSYVELFDLAPKLTFSDQQIKDQRDALDQGKDMCVTRFKNHAKDYGKQIDAEQKNLKAKTAKLGDADRKATHCRIQNLDLLKSEAQMLSAQAIPTAYDNLSAKLDILQKWPAQYKLVQQQIADESYMQRRWADVKDIGFREIAANQQDDIKRGQQAVEELKRTGLMPPEMDNKQIRDYVNTIAQKIARKSDLKVPLHITVLQSREINAFALPGGYLFINRGLLEAVDNESELAGVIAHEISHDVARHSNKLMNRATIASIFYQAAQIAAIILTGGAAGIALSYALQYGFYGLGLVIDLKLLGISRDYELEADQLGVQYAWNAGYDPAGFIDFFDKMATHEGYVNSVSWFRTHPAFYDRMVATEKEIMFLPPKAAAIVQTTEFEEMKKELAPVTIKAEKEEVERPSLLITREEGCAPPRKLEYKPGQPIEQICAAPAVTLSEVTPAK